MAPDRAGGGVISILGIALTVSCKGIQLFATDCAVCQGTTEKRDWASPAPKASISGHCNCK